MSLNVVGFDIGVVNSRVAVCRRNKVEVLENEYGSSQTPTCVAFLDGIRWVGTDAAVQKESNISATVSEFTSLIGKRMNNPEVAVDREYCSFPINHTPDGRLTIPIKCERKMINFRPEHLLAMQIKKLKTMAENAINSTVFREVVFGVPMSYGLDEKQAFIDAARIAGLKTITLLHATTAVGITFAYSGVPLPEEGMPPKQVAFVDVGHKYTQISICSFYKQKMIVIGTACDTNLGGRNFTRQIAEYIIRDISTFDPTHSWNPYYTLRLMQDIDRIKIRMCSNDENLPISIDYLHSKKVYKSEINRSTFENLTSALLTRFKNLINDCLQKSLVNPNDISTVQLIGGSSQIPALKKVVMDIFKRAKHVTEGNDTVARGCALYASLLAKAPTARGLEVIDNTVSENNVNGQLLRYDEQQITEMMVLEEEISKREMQEHARLAAKSALISYCTNLKQTSLGMKDQMELTQVCNWIDSGEHTQAEYEKRLASLKQLQQSNDNRPMLKTHASNTELNTVGRMTSSFTTLNPQRPEGPVRIIGSTTNLIKEHLMHATSTEKINRPQFEHSPNVNVNSSSYDRLSKPIYISSNVTSNSVSYEKLPKPGEYAVEGKPSPYQVGIGKTWGTENISRSTEHINQPISRAPSSEKVLKHVDTVTELKIEPTPREALIPGAQLSTVHISRPTLPTTQTRIHNNDTQENIHAEVTQSVSIRKQLFDRGSHQLDHDADKRVAPQRTSYVRSHFGQPLSKYSSRESVTVENATNKPLLSLADLPRADEPILYRTYSVRPAKDPRWHGGTSFVGIRPEPLPMPTGPKSKHGSTVSSAHDLSQAGSTSDTAPSKRALELYILTIQHRLQSRAQVLIDRKECARLTQMVEDIKRWLKESGGNKSNQEYEMKLDSLRSASEHFEESMDQAEQAIENYEKQLARIRRVIQTGQYEENNLTSYQLSELKKLVDERENWLSFCLDQLEEDTQQQKGSSSVELLQMKTREIDMIFKDIVSNRQRQISTSESKEDAPENLPSDDHQSSHVTFQQSTPIPQISASTTPSVGPASQESNNVESKFSDFYSTVDGETESRLEQHRQQELHHQHHQKQHEQLESEQHYQNGDALERRITIIRAPEAENHSPSQQRLYNTYVSHNGMLITRVDRPSTFTELYEHLTMFEDALAKRTLYLLSLKYQVYASQHHQTTALNQVLRKMRNEIQYFARPSAPYQQLKVAVKRSMSISHHEFSQEECENFINVAEKFTRCAQDDLNTLTAHMSQCTSWLDEMAEKVPTSYAKIYTCARDDLIGYRESVSNLYKEFFDTLAGFVTHLRGFTFITEQNHVNKTNKSIRSSTRKSGVTWEQGW